MARLSQVLSLPDEKEESPKQGRLSQVLGEKTPSVSIFDFRRPISRGFLTLAETLQRSPFPGKVFPGIIKAVTEPVIERQRSFLGEGPPESIPEQIGSGLGGAVALAPGFVASGGPVRFLVSKIPALAGIPIVQKALTAGGQFAGSELISGQPSQAPGSFATGAVFGPALGIQRFLPRVSATTALGSGTSALLAPEGQRVEQAAVGGGLGGLMALLPGRDQKTLVKPNLARVAFEAQGAAITSPTKAPPLTQPSRVQRSTQIVFPSLAKVNRPPSRYEGSSLKTLPSDFEVGSITPSNKIILQPTSNIKLLRIGAIRSKPIFDNTLKQVSSEVTGSSFENSRIKGPERLMSKVGIKGRSPQEVSDYLGGRIIVKDVLDSDSVLNSLSKRYRIVNDDNFFDKPKLGYRARHIQAQLENGMTAEVQVMPPEILQAKKMADPLYKLLRKDGIPLAQVEFIQRRLEKIFGSAWGRYLSRIRQTPQEIGRIQSGSIDPLLSPDSKSRVDKVMEALKEAKPVRRQQEALFTLERRKRLARLMSIRERIGGESGFKAELGQLKGELPKAQFESIRGRITQSDVDGLFNDINASSLDPWDSLHAKSGLAKMLEGQVPQKSELDLLSRVFGEDLTRILLKKRSFLQKSGDVILEGLNLPRAIMASVDLSAPLRQGIFLIGRPQQWIPAFGKMLKQFSSEKAFQEGQRQISSRLTYPLMKQSKLALTEIGNLITKREEQFMSRLSERLPLVGPLVRASNRAYVGFLNKLRADVFDDLLKKAQALGIDSESPEFLSSVSSFINAATGRGSLGRFQGSAIPLNSIFFSPRLLSSRLSLLNPAFYLKQNPLVRKEMLKSLFTFASTGAVVLGLARINGFRVGTDPRSADFGKVKIGNTRWDIWGGFQQLVVGAFRLLTGQMVSSTTGREFTLGEGFKPTTRLDIVLRILKSKQAPILSLVTTLLEGKTISGQKPRISVEIADRFIPMFLQDLFDVFQEHGLSKSWMAIPGSFGVGVQTYGDLIPLLEYTQSGSPTVKFRGEPSLGETFVNFLERRKVSNIPTEFHPSLIRSREIETAHQIDIDSAKKKVLETGRPIRVKNTLVFLKNGIVHTKTIGRRPLSPTDILRLQLRLRRNLREGSR